MKTFLEKLSHVYEKTDKSGGVIVISGVGGIGKTKLLRAMKAKAAMLKFRYLVLMLMPVVVSVVVRMGWDAGAGAGVGVGASYSVICIIKSYRAVNRALVQSTVLPSLL